MQFQYALWQGTVGHGLVANRVGAVVFGGFQITDTTDTGSGFSFLQTYADQSAPSGIIDGGVFNGKVNGQIPRFQSNPNAPLGGWNYTGNSPQYQFFDVPFDFSPGSPLENVSFETALANTDPTTGAVTVLGDFTWSFSTLAGLAGQPFAFGPAPSDSLLSLYGAAFPGTPYANGVLTPTGAIPEPSAWSLMILGVGGLGLRLRSRRVVAESGRLA